MVPHHTPHEQQLGHIPSCNASWFFLHIPLPSPVWYLCDGAKVLLENRPLQFATTQMGIQQALMKNHLKITGCLHNWEMEQTYFAYERVQTCPHISAYIHCTTLHFIEVNYITLLHDFTVRLAPFHTLSERHMAFLNFQIIISPMTTLFNTNVFQHFPPRHTP